MTRRALVNVGVGFWYPHGSHRLQVSLDTVGDIHNYDRLIWQNELPPGCPPHDEIPYAFKVHALLEARNQGYDQAVWVDCSCWAIRTLQPVWNILDRDGYYLEPDGHHVGEWVSAAALELLGVSRDQVWGWPLPEGKLMGVDFRHPAANAWLDDLHLNLDAFPGPWTNTNLEASPDARCRGHRHDIAVGAILAPRHGLTVLQSKLVALPTPHVQPADHVVLLSEGIGYW